MTDRQTERLHVILVSRTHSAAYSDCSQLAGWCRLRQQQAAHVRKY